MKKLNTGFSQYSNDDLYHLALNVVHKVGQMAIFTPLVFLLLPITTAAEALQTAVNLPNGPVREQSIIAARATLIGLLQNLAEQCESTPGVTDAQLAGTGYELRHTPTHTGQPPDAPQNVRLKAAAVSGQLLILLKAVLRADFYEVEWTFDPVNGPWTKVPAFGSTRGMKLVGLTRGKDYYVRVRAVAAGQNYGPWSDVATAMAV